MIGHAADFKSGNLRGNAHGHCTAVRNANTVARAEATGLWGMNKHLLSCAQVADQQLTAAGTKDTSLDGAGFAKGRLHNTRLQFYGCTPVYSGNQLTVPQRPNTEEGGWQHS